jgi:predicted exporter
MLALAAAAGLVASRATVREDLGAMLPDDRSAVGRDFALFSGTPLARTVLVALVAQPGAAAGALDEAAERVETTLGPPLFSPRQAPPDPAQVAALVPRALQVLAEPGDLERLAELGPREVSERLTAAYETLLSPQGMGAKAFLRNDPLGIAGPILGRIRPPGISPEGGRRQSGGDGRSLLLTLGSPVPMTDFGRALAIDGLLRTAAATLPPGVAMHAVSGHRYTLANAQAIRGDLALIIVVSSLAILGIYLWFLRSRLALFVFLVPMTVLLLATAGVALLPGGLFAMTLGFGGVLLGMTDEYANFVFFATRRGPVDQARAVGAAARPVVTGGLATAAAFGVMAFSSLPGQRQLAVFGLVGIATSVLISLVVLPHFVTPGGAAPPPLPRPRRFPARIVVPAWIALLALGLVGASRVRFDGSMTSLNYVTPELRTAEREVGKLSGDLGGKAIVFARGATLAEALERNEAVYRRLGGTLAPGEILSLAPVLPGAATRERRQAAWLAFWDGPQGARLRETLRAEGARLGFSAEAFRPFLDATARALPAPDPDALRAAGFGALVDAMLLPGEGGFSLLTLVPDDGRAVAALAGAGAPPGVAVVSPKAFGDTIAEALRREFLRYLLFSSLAIVAVVVLALRSARARLLALVPVATGVVVMFGAMGVLGITVNLFNIIASVLIIGICVDYGIFMVARSDAEAEPGAARAVLVSGLTTIAGVGVLVLAKHPALQSIGLTVLLGFGAAVPSALLVIPALAGAGRR